MTIRNFADVRPAYESPRLVVVASFPPEGGGGGGVIMRSLLEDFPEDRLAWFSLSPDRSLRTSWWKPGVARASFNWYLPGQKFSFVRRIASLGFDRIAAPACAASVARFIDAFRPSACWLVTSKAALPSLELIRLKLQVPYHLSVHDDPSVAAALAHDRFPLHEERCFESLIRGAGSVDCISERMRNLYKAAFGKESIVITRGFDGVFDAVELPRQVGRSDELGIVLAGWGDCPPPWPGDLLGALRLMRLRRNYRLYSFDPLLPAEPHIERMPRLTEPEFNRFVKDKSIGYACDPLTDAGRKFAATSFSTKVVTYIGHGLPFVYHGPRDSVVGDLLAKYKCGVIVESHGAEEIAAAFESLVENYDPLRRQCLAARADLFDAPRIRRRLFDYMVNRMDGDQGIPAVSV